MKGMGNVATQPSVPAAKTVQSLFPLPQQLVQQPLPVQQNSLMPQQRNALLSTSDRRNIKESSSTTPSFDVNNGIMEQIQATHKPDGMEVNVKHLLHIVEDIIHRATPPASNVDGTVVTHHANTTQQSHMDAFEDKTHHVDIAGMLEALSCTIHKISTEISCKCSGGGTVETTTLALFKTLSSYSWDAKVVIALTAFAVNYSEFWLLQQLPYILKDSDDVKPWPEPLKNLMKAMLDTTKCIALAGEIKLVDKPAMSTVLSHIPNAAYWTITSIVACSFKMISLVGLDHEYIKSTMKDLELLKLANMVYDIHGHLTKELSVFIQHRGFGFISQAQYSQMQGHQQQQYQNDKRHLEGYQKIQFLFETSHIDNTKILRALIYARDDPVDSSPLVEGSTQKRVHLDVLRRKNVLLLITDLDISQKELSILENIYMESRHQPTRTESQYEVVWLPIVDRTVPWTELKEKQFKSLQLLMPWYTVYHPSILDPAVIKYIKEVWRFEKKPILVVLDPKGRVVCPNALHMMWIWGSLAFPFTSMREEALWNEETWRLDLLVYGIDPLILNWISEGRFICLYGGEDIEWIRKFTTTALAVAQAARIPLELVYVGKSNPGERVRKNIATITVEKLSHCWQDLTSIWFFWVRLESMWYSKMQHGKTVENDTIMQEIVTMLSFDGSDQGWAVLSSGASLEMAKAKGETMLTCFTQYDAWKENVEQKGFVLALNDYLHGVHSPHHCNRFILPWTRIISPEMVACLDCGRPMENYIIYRCCTDD